MMKLLRLSRGLSAVVDDEDYERASAFKWCALPTHGTFYAMRNLSPNGRMFLHHFILGVNMQIDHINHNGLDNQKRNLRPCSTSQNAMNRRLRKTSKSGRKGACWISRSRKWAAYIQVNKRKVHLGYFESLEKAANAYDVAAIKYFGTFALTNAELAAE